MNKFLKYSLCLLGVAIAIVITGIVYIVSTFDPNDYKNHIIKLVKEKQQRTLKLDGDIHLVLFPQAGIEITKASLSDFQSETQFMYIESAHLSLELLPLLSKKLIIDEILIKGIKTTLIKFKDGKTNIDDLLSLGKSGEKQTPLIFDIASVRAKESELIYFNEMTGERYTFSEIKLNTGRIANNIPIKIDYSMIVHSIKPALNISTQLNSTIIFDSRKNLFHLNKIKLKATGTAFDISNLDLLAEGSAHTNFGKQEFSAKTLTINASGKHEQYNFDAKLDIPALNLSQNIFTGDKVTLKTRIDSSFGNVFANLIILGPTGNPHSFRSNALLLELDLKQPGQKANIKIGSPVIYKVDQQLLTLPNLALALYATDKRIPDKLIDGKISGNLQVDVLHQNVHAEIAGGLLQSQVEATVVVNGFQNPAIRFNIDIDQLDADSYLPEDAIRKPSAPTDKPFNFTFMENLNLEGKLHIGALKIANIKLSQVHLDIQAANRSVTIKSFPSDLNDRHIKSTPPKE